MRAAASREGTSTTAVCSAPAPARSRPPRIGGGPALRLQPKLALGRADDPAEDEADRIADQVMSGGGDGVVRRACASCGGSGEDEACPTCGTVRRAAVATAAAPPAISAPPAVAAAISAPGRALDAGDRSFMEARLGADLAGVRVHDDAAAAGAARAIGALAFTAGQHVAFAAGRYAPGTTAGRRLLAHELAHVMQQDGVVRRTCDPAAQTTVDETIARIRAKPDFRSHRRITNQIIDLVRAHDRCLYFIEHLEALFDTPEAPPSTTTAAMRGETTDAATAERERLATPEGARQQGLEEAVADAPGRTWTTRRGMDGKRFEVDVTDPNNLVVRARVRLVRRGTGTADDVAMVAGLEDGIEKAAQANGYTLDLQFVNRGGRDVFTVGVDMSEWTVADNWVGNVQGLAHELHHLLGLDDRYDYSNHAYNQNMARDDRLHWFRVQVSRPEDPQGPNSLMGSGPRLLDDDVCNVAGLGQACIDARRARTAGIETARTTAWQRTFRAYQTAAGIAPPSPFDRDGEPTAADRARSRAQRLADRLIEPGIDGDQLADVLRSMVFAIGPRVQIETAPAQDSECGSRAAYVVGMRPPIRLCPAFFTDSAEQQVRTFVHEAAHLARVAEAHGESYCGLYDCQTRCGDFNTADAWSHFVHCLSGQAADAPPVVAPAMPQDPAPLRGRVGLPPR